MNFKPSICHPWPSVELLVESVKPQFKASFDANAPLIGPYELDLIGVSRKITESLLAMNLLPIDQRALRIAMLPFLTEEQISGLYSIKFEEGRPVSFKQSIGGEEVSVSYDEDLEDMGFRTVSYSYETNEGTLNNCYLFKGIMAFTSEFELKLPNLEVKKSGKIEVLKEPGVVAGPLASERIYAPITSISEFDDKSKATSHHVKTRYVKSKIKYDGGEYPIIVEACEEVETKAPGTDTITHITTYSEHEYVPVIGSSSVKDQYSFNVATEVSDIDKTSVAVIYTSEVSIGNEGAQERSPGNDQVTTFVYEKNESGEPGKLLHINTQTSQGAGSFVFDDVLDQVWTDQLEETAKAAVQQRLDDASSALAASIFDKISNGEDVSELIGDNPELAAIVERHKEDIENGLVDVISTEEKTEVAE